MTAVADYCIGLGDTEVVEGLVSSDVEVGESLVPLAVETCQAFRTYCNTL